MKRRRPSPKSGSASCTPTTCPASWPRTTARCATSRRFAASTGCAAATASTSGSATGRSCWPGSTAPPNGWPAASAHAVFVHKALELARLSLRNQTQALEERNVALKVLVDQRRDDLDALRLSVTDNVEQLVTPSLDLLADALQGRPESALVEAVRLTLDEITRPLLARPDGASGGGPRLSRREYQVLQLIKVGQDHRRDRPCPLPVAHDGHLPPRQHPPEDGAPRHGPAPHHRGGRQRDRRRAPRVALMRSAARADDAL